MCAALHAVSDNIPKVTVPVYSEYSVIIQPDSGETAERSESWRHNVVNVTSLQAVARCRCRLVVFRQ